MAGCGQAGAGLRSRPFLWARRSGAAVHGLGGLTKRLALRMMPLDPSALQAATQNESKETNMIRFNLPRLLVAVLTLAASLPLAAQGRNPFMPQAAATSTPATIDICDRTPQVETEILKALELTAVDCAAAPADRMALIKILIFEDHRDMASLRRGDFDNLAALEALDSGGSQLSAIPSGIFDNLTALEELYCPAPSSARTCRRG